MVTRPTFFGYWPYFSLVYTPNGESFSMLNVEYNPQSMHNLWNKKHVSCGLTTRYLDFPQSFAMLMPNALYAHPCQSPALELVGQRAKKYPRSPLTHTPP